MSHFNISHVKISGLAVGVPAKNIDNQKNPLFKPAEAESFIKNIGIAHVRRAEGKSLTDLCLPVAKKLMGDLKWNHNTLELLVLITQTPDYKIPPASLILQDKLQMPKTSMAFDINLGCSGYVYGLYVIASLMKASGQKKALLCVGDISSSCISEYDKSTAPLFSDAVSVTALELTDSPCPMYFNLQSDGSGFDAIKINDGGSRNPLKTTSLCYMEEQQGVKLRPVDMHLNGIKVFNFSLREVVANINALLNYKNDTLNNYDYVILHQANKLMNESIRKKLNLPIEKVPSSMFEYGNTSSASIPLTLVHALQKKLIANPLKLILSGFGVGLSWGSVALEIDSIICPELIEIE